MAEAPPSATPPPRPAVRDGATLDEEAQLLRQGLAAERQGRFSDARAALSTLKGTVDVWVGVQDRMVRQERIIMTVRLPSIEPGGDPMTGAVDLTIAYSKLNEPVDIRDPARNDAGSMISSWFVLLCA